MLDEIPASDEDDRSAGENLQNIYSYGILAHRRIYGHHLKLIRKFFLFMDRVDEYKEGNEREDSVRFRDVAVSQEQGGQKDDGECENDIFL